MDNVPDDEPSSKTQKLSSTRQSRGKTTVQPRLSKPATSSNLPLPVLLHKDLKDVWKINRERSLLLQRDIDVENFNSCCNLVDLFRSQNILQRVTNVGPYFDLVTREFYTNLSE